MTFGPVERKGKRGCDSTVSYVKASSGGFSWKLSHLWTNMRCLGSYQNHFLKPWPADMSLCASSFGFTRSWPHAYFKTQSLSQQPFDLFWLCGQTCLEFFIFRPKMDVGLTPFTYVCHTSIHVFRGSLLPILRETRGEKLANSSHQKSWTSPGDALQLIISHFYFNPNPKFKNTRTIKLGQFFSRWSHCRQC